MIANPGTLRTEITFRRPVRKMPWRLIALAGGGVAVLIAVAVAAGLFDDEPSSANDPAGPPAATQTNSGESVAEPSASPEATPPEQAPRVKSDEESVLTVENNADLAALVNLTDYCSDKIVDFAAEYEGQTITFDANIAAMNVHGNYDTRYDILLGTGDFSETSTMGPTFQFRDVNTTNDLHFMDQNHSETIGAGDNLRITARVGDYENASCRFLLEPLGTEYR